MCKFYGIIVIVCATAMLLCGCNNEAVPGDGTQPSDILGSQPTNPITQPTNPTTEPTAPTTEPTEPSTEPTEPDGPIIPPLDMPFWDFNKKYTILKSPNVEGRVEVFINGVGSYTDVLDGTTVCTADGKTIFHHHGLLFIWESNSVFQEIGMIAAQGYESIMYRLCDGEYVFDVNLDLVDIRVYYRYADSVSEELSLYYNLEGVTSVRIEVSEFDEKQVKIVAITEEGEIEITPVDGPY